MQAKVETRLERSLTRKQMLLDLAGRGAREFGDEFEAPRHFVRGEAGAAERGQLGVIRMPPIRREFLMPDRFGQVPASNSDKKEARRPAGLQPSSRSHYCCWGGLPFCCVPIDDVFPDGFCVPVADASCTKPFLRPSLNSASEIWPLPSTSTSLK